MASSARIPPYLLPSIEEMVGVRTISRSKTEWTKDRLGELPRAHRNFNPVMAPFSKPMEYARALRAAKMDRMFARPFVAALSGHRDTVQCLAVDRENVPRVASGGFDGEVIVWDTVQRKFSQRFSGHVSSVSGLVFTVDGAALLTASPDRTVKLWDLGGERAQLKLPSATFIGESGFTSIDRHEQLPRFATAGQRLDIWDMSRGKPLASMTWGDDSLSACAINKIQTDLVACCSRDRGVAIFDTRTRSGHSKVVLELSCSSISWNPMDPQLLVAGSDDWNCYLFDTRVPGRPRNVLQGHIHPVTSVDFCPTGKSIVAGSEDSTIRIWNVSHVVKTTSSEMFHTKRMAKVHAVKYSLDNKYVISGSEDAVVRIWKAEPSIPVRALRGSEPHTMNYLRALKDKYSAFQEVRRISSQRNMPKAIRVTQAKKRRIVSHALEKEMARKRHDKVASLASRKVVQSIM